MKLPEVFHRYRKDIEAEMQGLLHRRQDSISPMLRYHLGWEDEAGHPANHGIGKALRSTLCLVACQGYGGEWRQEALPAAAALELLHNFSLIHDDIQDGDKERRHRPTVWYLWGKGQAIIAGDSLFSLSHLTLAALADRGIAPSLRWRASHILNQSCLSMIEGQCLDLAFEGSLNITLEDYLEMIAKKTAALISASLQIGALLGKGEERLIAGLGNFGQKLGLAFQIKDDILGIWGDERATGKPSGNDLLRRKKSLPVIYALYKQGEASHLLASIYSREGSKEVEGALQLLERIKAREFCQEMAETYVKQALEELKGLPLTPHCLSDLEEIASFVVERES